MIKREFTKIQGLPDDVINYIYDETNRNYNMIRNTVLVNLVYEMVCGKNKL